MRRILIAPVGLALALMTGCSWMGGGHPSSRANAGSQANAGNTVTPRSESNTSSNTSSNSTSSSRDMSMANAQSGAQKGPTNQEVRQAQQKLQQMGLYKGRIDGLYGPKTIAAVNQFQSKNGLPQTGALTSTTQQHLAQAEPSQNQTRNPPETAQAPNGQPANEPQTNEPNNEQNSDQGSQASPQPNAEPAGSDQNSPPSQNQNR